MNQLTFIDKIHVLFKLLFSSPIIIGIFVFSMFLMMILFFSSKINKKIVKYGFIVVYVGIIGFSIFKYGSYFLTSIDSFLTLFMANIYFPIIPVYVVIMLISFFIIIITLNDKGRSQIVKIINIVFFTIIQMLFALFIYIVETSHIDLSTNTNLYSNEQTMTLLELGMGLFIIWIIILVIVFYLKKADKIYKVKKNDAQDDFDEYINDYNEPKNNFINPVNSDFKNNLVQSLVPETSNIDSQNEVVSFNASVSQVSEPNSYVSDSNSSNFVSNNILPHSNNQSSSFNNNDSIGIFDSFQFLDVSKSVERKDDDVEIIDFD